VSHVQLERFEAGIRVTWSNPPLAGCNLALTSSTIESGWYGVVADGYDMPSGPVQAVSVRIGDLMGGGNDFVNLDIPASENPPPLLVLYGAGLMTCDAVTGVVVEGNHFFQQSGMLSDWGIYAVHSGSFESPGFDIEGNEFGPLTGGGMMLWGAVIADRLLDNSFHDNSMVPGYQYPATGINIHGDAADMPSPVAVVLRARGNTFFGNDVGVTIAARSSFLTQDPVMATDFGTAADPGHNTFRCNSVPPERALGGVGGPGADVFLSFPVGQPASVTVPFEGNAWDHAPPTTTVAPWANAAPGTDVYNVGDPTAGPVGPTLDTANATATDMPPCPAGRVAGP
jgi:hypothetical protein